MKNDNLRWDPKEKKELLKTAVFTVNQVTSNSPDKKSGNFIVLDAPDWCIVIPELENDFLMVRQWRHGENSLSIEFPGGVIEKDESPEKAAMRELLEETGYKAGKMTYLGKANPNPAIMSNHIYFFMAQNLIPTGKQHLDNDEYINYMKIPKNEVFNKFGDEEYSHALMMSALFRYFMHK